MRVYGQDWVDLPFFRSHRFLLLSDVLIGAVETVVVVDGVEGTSWSINLWANSLALLKVVGCDAKTFPRYGGTKPQMYRSIFLLSVGTMLGHRDTRSQNLAVSAIMSVPFILRFQSSSSSFWTSPLGQYFLVRRSFSVSQPMVLAVTKESVTTRNFLFCTTLHFNKSQINSS